MDKIQPPHFELCLTIYDVEINDIQHFTIFRCPIRHTASYCIASVNIKTMTYLNLEDDIRNNIHPIIKLDLYLPDTKDTSERQTGKRIEHFCTKTYKLIQIKPSEKLKEDEPYISCDLYLVNPIFHFLNSINNFNKSFVDKSAIEILIDYETYLSDVYENSKTNLFNFIKVNQDFEINDYKYIQLILKSKNDLIVPSYIIENLKTHNPYSYYFFDDFRIDEENTSDICCYFINLGSKDNFTKRDISDEKYSEILAGLTPKEIYNVNDSFNKLNKILTSDVHFYIDNKYKFDSTKRADGDTLEIETLSTTKDSVEDIELEYGRKIKGVYSKYGKVMSNKLSNYFNAYSPDKFENIIKRYDFCKKLLCTDIHSIERFYISNSFFDFFQFNCIYNVQLVKSSDYSYIPLNIVNSFERTEAENVGLVTFNTDLLMMKYKSDV